MNNPGKKASIIRMTKRQHDEAEALNRKPNNGHRSTCHGGEVENGRCQECLNDVSGPPQLVSKPLPATVVRRSPIQPRKGQKPTIRVKPHIGTLLWDSYTVLAHEIRRLKEKAESGEALNQEEARRLHKHIESLARLASEERKQEAGTNTEELDDAELLALSDKAKKVLGA